jgi:hypothetical protein
MNLPLSGLPVAGCVLTGGHGIAGGLAVQVGELELSDINAQLFRSSLRGGSALHIEAKPLNNVARRMKNSQSAWQAD